MTLARRPAALIPHRGHTSRMFRNEKGPRFREGLFNSQKT
jgi:hypothetical protein